MIVQTLTVGPLATNCYILACEKTCIGAIIDPGAEGNRIIDEVKSKKLKIKYIINTHGHSDHIQANEDVKKTFSCPVCMHENEEGGFPPPDKKLKEGEEIEIGNLSLSILHTPGHSAGGISIVVEKKRFYWRCSFRRRDRKN